MTTYEDVLPLIQKHTKEGPQAVQDRLGMDIESLAIGLVEEIPDLITVAGIIGGLAIGLDMGKNEETVAQFSEFLDSLPEAQNERK